MSKAREENAKTEADNLERARYWDNAKEKEKAEISGLADKARDKAELEVKARKNVKTVNRVAVEVAANIRASADIRGEKRDRAEAETRAKAEAEI